MGKRISVLVVDDSYQLRESVKAMLQFEDDFDVAGEAEDGLQAVAQARQLKPDVVLMDINMPNLDGLGATTRIMQECPTNVVIISVQGEQEYLRRAMQAGVRDYLIKPFTVEELVGAIRRVNSQSVSLPAPAGAAAPAPPRVVEPPRLGKLITLFSTKGGVGKTTLSTNLAVALATRTRLKVVAIDLDLEFGGMAAMFGLKPAATILDLCRVDGPLRPELVARVMSHPPLGAVDVLAAPPLPHLASEVDGEARPDRSRSYVAEVLDLLKSQYDYVVVDTAAGFRETNLLTFDRSDLILLVTSPEVPTLANTAKGLDVLLDRLEFPPDKVRLVLNRSDAMVGLTHQHITQSLGCPICYLVPSDGQAVAWAANAGQPLVLKRAKTPAAQAIQAMAVSVAGVSAERLPSATATDPGSGRRRLFGILPLAR